MTFSSHLTHSLLYSMEAFFSPVIVFTTIFAAFLFNTNIQAVSPPPPPPLVPAPSPSSGIAGALVVFQWPMAYCKLNPGCDKEIPDDKFLLHGVWPTDGQGISIKNCGVPFSNTAARSVPNLDRYWRGLNTPTKDFWKYEWDTHGSCSGQTVQEYFTNSRNLCKKYNTVLYQKIVEAGFRPSSKTDMKGQGLPTPIAIYHAIHSKLNLIPIIVCGEKDGKSYLLEIRLCATADLLKFKNCPVGKNYINCAKSNKVLFYTSSHRLSTLLTHVIDATSIDNA